MAETQVNSVSVTSIDEERLKFRVILGVDAVATLTLLGQMERLLEE